METDRTVCTAKDLDTGAVGTPPPQRSRATEGAAPGHALAGAASTQGPSQQGRVERSVPWG